MAQSVADHLDDAGCEKLGIVVRMGKIYSLLGLSVAAIEEDMTQDEKMKAYKANVVYVTAQQLCFDYLGDWTASSEHDLVSFFCSSCVCSFLRIMCPVPQGQSLALRCSKD